MKAIKIGKNAKDITGQTFERLTAIMPVSRNKQGQIFWYLECSCGNTTVAKATNVIRGLTRSCGCLHDEVIRKTHYIHGRADTPEHVVWMGMRDRCTNANNPSYERYGGRGISVCERWSEFTNFFADMGERPSPQHSVERINNDGDYTPNNCRWATRKEQANNRRTSRILDHDGLSLTVSQWADKLGIRAYTIYCRLRAGWTVERALTQPVRKGRYSHHVSE